MVVLLAAFTVLATVCVAAVSAAPRHSDATGGTLTFISANAPFAGGLDPAAGNSTQGAFTQLAYDPLIVQKSDGSFAPGLALSWKYGYRNKSFSMKLRPGVKFSDGRTFNARAVRDWLNYALKLPGGGASQYIKGLTKIKLDGPLSLTLNFNTPTPLLPLILSQGFTVGLPASPAAIAAKNLATQTTGAGQYVLDPKQTVVGDTYTYLPNPTYWNKSAVYWKKVVVKVITNPATALQALKAGEAQVAASQPAGNIAAATSSGLKASTALSLMFAWILGDRGGALSKPLGDVRVRQALNYAIDRVAIAKALGAGYGKPIHQMAIEGDDSYVPALKNAYPYNPAKAKALLAQAGYPNGFSFSATGVPFIGLDTMSQALKAQLAQVGVDVKLDILDAGTFFGGVLGRKYSAHTVSWGRGPAAIQYPNLWGPSAAFGNPFDSRNAQISKLYYKMIQAPEAQGRAAAQDTMKVLTEQAWFLPVFAGAGATFYSPKVTGIVTTPQRFPYAVEVRPAG